MNRCIRKSIADKILNRSGLDLCYFDDDRNYTAQHPKTMMVYKGDYLKLLVCLIENRGLLKENPIRPFILPNY